MDAPLDVVMVLPSLDVGGAERVAISLANGLLRAGAAPRLLLTHREGAMRDQLDPGIPVAVLGRPRIRGALAPLARHLRAEPPAVLFGTHQHVNLALCGLTSVLPRRTRLVLREPIFAPVALEGRSTTNIRRLQRALYRRAALLLASSDVLAEDLRRLTGAEVALLHNPVDEPQLRSLAQAPTRSLIDTAETSRPYGRRFVSVGRLSPQKAMDELLVAFATARGKLDTLVIIGDGLERPRLERLVVDLGLEDSVTIHATRPDHLRIVAAADVLVLASHHEGMPNAALEALAVGTPVLATTDLVTLSHLSRSTSGGAVRLVERSILPSALADTAPTGPRPADGAEARIPRPSLLPQEHRLEHVVPRLIELLRERNADR